MISPKKRIQLSRDKVGYEIVLTASGHREPKDSITNMSIVDESIPLQFRQASYDKEHGCV